MMQINSNSEKKNSDRVLSCLYPNNVDPTVVLKDVKSLLPNTIGQQIAKIDHAPLDQKVPNQYYVIQPKVDNDEIFRDLLTLLECPKFEQTESKETQKQKEKENDKEKEKENDKKNDKENDKKNDKENDKEKDKEKSAETKETLTIDLKQLICKVLSRDQAQKEIKMLKSYQLPPKEVVNEKEDLTIMESFNACSKLVDHKKLMKLLSNPINFNNSNYNVIGSNNNNTIDTNKNNNNNTNNNSNVNSNKDNINKTSTGAQVTTTTHDGAQVTVGAVTATVTESSKPPTIKPAPTSDDHDNE